MIAGCAAQHEGYGPLPAPAAQQQHGQSNSRPTSSTDGTSGIMCSRHSQKHDAALSTQPLRQASLRPAAPTPDGNDVHISICSSSHQDADEPTTTYESAADLLDSYLSQQAYGEQVRL